MTFARNPPAVHNPNAMKRLIARLVNHFRPKPKDYVLCFLKTGHRPYEILAPNLYKCMRCQRVWQEETQR